MNQTDYVNFSINPKDLNPVYRKPLVIEDVLFDFEQRITKLEMEQKELKESINNVYKVISLFAKKLIEIFGG